MVKWGGGVFCLLLKLGPTWPTLTSRPTLQKRSTTHLAGRGFHKKEYKVGTPGKTLHLKGPLTWHRWGYSLFPEYMIWRFDLSITWPNFECFHPGVGADNGFLLLQIPWDCGSTALPPFLHFPPLSSQPGWSLNPPSPRRGNSRKSWEMRKISVATCEVPLDQLSTAQLELKRLSRKKPKRGKLSRFTEFKNQNWKVQNYFLPP